MSRPTRSADLTARRTIHDVARRAGVSITTVSRTLNNSLAVEPDTASRVWRAVEELNYYPDTHARSLVSGRSRMLGLIVSDITNPFFPELVKRFEEVVIQHGYDILVSSTDYDSARMAACVRRMMERKVDGVAVMTSEAHEHLTDQLARRKVPMVFLDVGTPRLGVSNILVNYGLGINEAVEHLVHLGHHRIGFISGPDALRSARVRRLAFSQSLAKNGIREEEGLVVQSDHKVDGGFAAMMRLLQVPHPPTAVLASNDLTAVGMMRAVRSFGLSVPKDISIVGFDDIWLAQYVDPPLTTVRLSRRELAEKACQALLHGVGGTPDPNHSGEYPVETHLVIRESTCKVL